MKNANERLGLKKLMLRIGLGGVLGLLVILVGLYVQKVGRVEDKLEGAGEVTIGVNEIIEESSFSKLLDQREILTGKLFQLKGLAGVATEVAEEEVVIAEVSQGEKDKLYNQSVSEFKSLNPWLESLPIKTESYKVVYDYERGAFRIRFLKTDYSEKELEDVKSIALAVIQDLEGVGADFDYYFILPSDELIRK